jgi:polysaccharide export outer membrane protein
MKSMSNTFIITLTAAFASLAAITGCQSPPAPTAGQLDQRAEIVLRAGDQVRISFPGAASLDTPPQPIRRDGKITLPVIGEVTAAGMTPTDLQKQLLTQFSGQLLSKEVIVAVVSSSFDVFIDGSVLRPGKLTSDHPMTVLEAIMEAGGFDYSKANTKHVEIIRHQGLGGTYTYFTLDLKGVLDGTDKSLFYLAPGDVVHVPEKFTWF